MLNHATFSSVFSCSCEIAFLVSFTSPPPFLGYELLLYPYLSFSAKFVVELSCLLLGGGEEESKLLVQRIVFISHPAYKIINWVLGRYQVQSWSTK